ncbi:ABC transporter ATP-binding protein [Halorhabdus sp. SVX81]|uniref:ABC transporter ATP-binding protein n=1 Tax=Halorhabdus sp. SVX81 TaxID=2978283 RepID=UPI0023DBAA49|nr:ABC transporter ATP-binding protein [Halorhabdus sp. SVX81]
MTLRVCDLRVDYPATTVGPLSLTVPPGVTAVLGPSGTGKSTLLSAIAGFEEHGGTVILDGERLDGRPPEDRAVGMVFQDGALFPHLSVRENLAFGSNDGDDIETAASRLEIDHLLDRAPETLSGGERQRVALARTLVADPDALLLDEPLSSLDAPIRRRLRVVLREVLADLAVPVLYVTHDRQEATIVGDRLAVLVEGAIVQTGPVETVVESPKTPQAAQFVGYETLIDGTVVERGDDWAVVDVGPTTVRVPDDVGVDEVTIAVRPADATLAPSNSATALDCRVVSITAQHGDALVDCAWPGGDPIRARVDRAAVADLSAGDRCRVGIDPEASRLLPQEG